MPQIPVPTGDALTLDALSLSVPAQRNRSGWTGRSQTVGLPGAEVWTASITIDGIATEVEEWPWRAFLLSLRGIANWFALPVACQRHIGPKPIVGAGAVPGYALPLTGMQPRTRILRAGQWLTIPVDNGRLVGLTADLETDASGKAVAQFSPAIDRAPVAGAVVETANPFVPMSLAEGMVGFDYDGGVAGRSFALEEAR